MRMGAPAQLLPCGTKQSGHLAHRRYPLGNNLIVGIDNKTKFIKRMAYGFRDDAYFFLKIRTVFPGVG